MSPQFVLEFAIVPALRLLPDEMTSPGAEAMLLAIGAQESGFDHRRQIGNGPGLGFWQFEQGGGVLGVLRHPATKRHIQAVLTALDYDPASDPETCYGIIEHNDIMAAAFARLLLWTVPAPLPVKTAPMLGWSQYVSVWRPGKPHRETWDKLFESAWEII
jgi:hypothetical protein